MKKRTLIIGLIFLFFNGIAQRQLPGVIVGDMEGKSGDIRRILNDSVPVVLAFWGTTCKPCIQELDALSEVFEDWKKRVDFKVVAVSTDDSRAAVKVRPMVEGREWPFTVILDRNQDLKRAMNVNGIPFLFVLDKTGRIVYTHNGYTPGAETAVLSVLEKLRP